MGKVYRNIYFKKNIIRSGVGQDDVHYYGQLYSNADSIKNFMQMYDKTQDLYIPCTECAAHKYRNFIRTTKK